MRKFMTIAAAAALLGYPAHAAGWQNGAQEIRTGGFVGARLRLPLGISTPARPQAAIMLSLTQSRRSISGRSMTLIGEGLALDFAGRTPRLTLAGMPADVALGLRPHRDAEARRKLGISKGGWIAIGAVSILGAALVVAKLTCVGRDKDFCGSD
jgi:hypothetical protein